MSDNYTSQINEAFEALKYNPQATQQLLQQQQKNPGSAQGPQTLAAAAAANYQKSLQAPPPQQPPQQSVIAGLTQQPQMPMGLEAPYLEDFAQQQQQQRMATGGIVALAHGGPVQGYAGGGLSIPGAPWVGTGRSTFEHANYGPAWTLSDLFDFDSQPSQSEQEYYQTTEPSPSKRRELFSKQSKSNPADYQAPNDPADLIKALNDSEQNPDFSYMDKSPSSQMPKIDLASLGSTPYTPSSGDGNQTVVVDTEDETTPTAKPVAERTMGESSSKVPKLSFDKQVEGLASLYEGDHALAAELKGQLEKRMAHESNVNLIKDIAAGVGGFLGARGYGQERVGTGIMTALASMGQHGTQEDALQAKIDALNLQQETQHNAARHEALKSVLGTQAKSAEMQQEQLNKLAQISLENEGKIQASAARAGGQGPKGMASQNDIMDAQAQAWTVATNMAKEAGKQLDMEWIKQKAQDIFKSITTSGLGHTPGAASVAMPQQAQIPRVAYQPPPTR